LHFTCLWIACTAATDGGGLGTNPPKTETTTQILGSFEYTATNTQIFWRSSHSKLQTQAVHQTIPFRGKK